jgi:glucokinase
MEGRTVLRLSNGRIEEITAKTLLTAARMGDEFALKLFQDAGRYLGMAIAQAVLLLDLEGVAIGSGVARAGAILLNPLMKTLHSLLLPIPKSSVKVLKSRLGDKVGLLSAISLVRKEMRLC